MANTVTVKKQLGWRLQTADEQLFTPLFRFAHLERMHLIPYGEVTKRCEKFVDDLFATRQAFIGSEKTSVKSIRDQFDARIEAFKKEVGWESGRCQNLSGKEGDMSEPSSKEQFLDEHQKTIKATDKEIMDQNEVPVLIDSLGNQSKKKRLSKFTNDSFTKPSKSTSSADTPTDTTTLLKDSINAFTRMVNDKSPSPSKKKLKHALESDVEEKMMEQIGNFNMLDFLAAAGIKSALISCENLSTYEDIGVDTIVNIYCTPLLNFDAGIVKQNWQQCGITVLHSNKLYTYLTKLKNSLL